MTVILNKRIFQKLKKKVTKFVQECQLCQRAREGPNLTPGLLQPLEIPTSAWDTVSMDFITQLPATSNGKTSVLTIVDSLSKRVRLIPTCDDVTAEGVAKLFFDFIVTQFGLLRCIRHLWH